MRRRATNVMMVVALGVAAAASWSKGSGSAAEPDRDAAARGATTYRLYCGSCHGRAAKGDGKLAESLRQQPPDLTQLARNNGGVFDADKVREKVDGRQAVAPHGDRDMPVWGYVFEQFPPVGETGTEEEVRAHLDDLVAYLATLQAPAEE